jgi:hypothetical protein
LTAFEVACLRSFIDHGHQIVVFAYDHATTPDFCTRADAREILPQSSVFAYTDGFGAGSVAAFANLFRYALLLRRGGWWIDTDVVCLDADWPAGEVVAGWQCADLVCNAVLRLPPGHPLAAEAVAECVAAGQNVVWGQTGPSLLTRLFRDHGLSGVVLPPLAFYPLAWSEWLDVLDPSCAESVAARVRGAYALHVWNALLRHHGFERALAPPAGSFLRAVFARHGGLRGFVEGDQRTARSHIALVREHQARSAHMRAAIGTAPAGSTAAGGGTVALGTTSRG